MSLEANNTMISMRNIATRTAKSAPYLGNVGWKGLSETRIEDYYADLLRHLHGNTAFLALNDQRKPIGYATWLKAAQEDEYTLTRQAAPFGDHRALQSALERHLGKTAGVTARHARSATQEQVAW